MDAFNIGGLLSKAQEMQGRIQGLEKEIASQEVIGESGAGLVQVTMTGRYQVQSMQIDPSLLQEGVAVLQDLIVGACNDAMRKIEARRRDLIERAAQGLPAGAAEAISKMFL